MFRDFSSFEIEDFAFDESFQKWVTANDAAHNDFWERYTEEHPHQIDKILAARELVLKLAARDSENRSDKMADAIWANVREHTQTPSLQLFRKWRLPQIAAAVALLVTGTCVYLWYGPVVEGPQDSLTYLAHPAPENGTLTERVNNTDTVIDMVLADGSTISLDRNSRISYPENFDSKERVVQLHGEAFFDIAKDPRRPFIIFANKTVVKVLGTSFRVKAYDDSAKVIVSVKSGKVSVFERKDFEKDQENPQMSGLVLMANQQAEFSKDLEKFSKTLVPEPLLVGSASKTEFDFDQTPLSNVFETLEKAYRIEILYDSDLVAGRSLKVSLEDETLFEKLDVICQTMGLSYHIVDAKVIIESQ